LADVSGVLSDESVDAMGAFGARDFLAIVWIP
jgi:hypothetical protein